MVLQILPQHLKVTLHLLNRLLNISLHIRRYMRNKIHNLGLHSIQSLLLFLTFQAALPVPLRALLSLILHNLQAQLELAGNRANSLQPRLEILVQGLVFAHVYEVGGVFALGLGH